METSQRVLQEKYTGSKDNSLLYELLEVLSRLRDAETLQEKLDLIVEGVSICGWRRVHLCLFDPDLKLSKSAAYWGATDEEKKYLSEHHLSAEQIDALMSEKFDKYKLGRCYYIPFDADEDLRRQLHETSLQGTIPLKYCDGWNPRDFMFVPLFGKYSKRVMGLMSLDDPLSGKKPDESSLRPVELFIDYVTSLIEESQYQEYFSKTKNLISNLFTLSPIMIFLTDENGKVIDANQQALKSFLYAKEGMLNLEEKDLFADEDEYNEMKTLRELGKKIKQEVLLVKRNQKHFWGYLTSVGVQTGNNRLEGNILMIVDVTESKNLQQQLIQAEKMAGIGVLASGIAHELNNPLYGILGLGEEILEKSKDPVLKEYASEIIKYAQETSEIVKDLSSYSYSTKSTISSTANINDALNSALKMLEIAGRFENLEIEKNFAEIPEINANMGELQQLFVNLLSNALDAMPEGGKISLTTRVTGNFIEVMVKDTGSGIDDTDLNKIFEPFFTTKEIGEGTGLGLYICYKIITKYGGTIDVDSQKGKGTTVTVRFAIR
ncbi:PAS domain-containing protein [bacterium]|nr:PAS domain-containing protein [bacterium]